MKKEAVKKRPIASMNTDSVGYHETATGLVMGFAAFEKKRDREIEAHGKTMIPDKNEIMKKEEKP